MYTYHIIILQNVLANSRSIHPRHEILQRARNKECWILDQFGTDSNVALVNQLGGVLDVLRHFVCKRIDTNSNYSILVWFRESSYATHCEP